MINSPQVFRFFFLLRGLTFNPQEFITDDEVLQNFVKCFLNGGCLVLEFSRASNNSSKTLHGSLWDYVRYQNGIFWVKSQTFLIVDK